MRARRGVNWAAVTSMGTVIVALGALGALGFTASTVRATQQQVALAEQGQITDRYARAIEQVGRHGADNLQVRLGGIYALERLARDSPRDQPTIVEVLSAFIRTTLPNPGDDGKCPHVTLPSDVEAAFAVLHRRDHAHDASARPDLHKTCLSGADLVGLGLTEANLAGADLSRADLRGADLTDADLPLANLTEANLAGADLAHAYLLSADLTGADLSGADLTHADLRGADLRGARHDNRTTVNAAQTDDRTVGIWW